TGQHRELQQNMPLAAVEGIIDHLAALEKNAVPQIDQLLAEMRLHLAAKYLRQALQQGWLVGRQKQLQRFVIDFQHPDFVHALAHEFRMHIGENAKVDNAAMAYVVHEFLDLAEILDPE